MEKTEKFYKFKKDKTLYVDIDGKNYKVNIVYDKKLKKHRRIFPYDHIVLRLPEGTPDEWVYDYFSKWEPKSWVKGKEEEYKYLIKDYQKIIEKRNLKLEPKSLDELKEIVEKYVKKYESDPLLKHPKKIHYKELYGAWGRCSKSKDELSFNILLSYLPEEYIEHVVCHEMTHTYCLNHNAPFHRKLMEVYPDFQKWEHNLDVFGYLLCSNELYFWSK